MSRMPYHPDHLASTQRPPPRGRAHSHAREVFFISVTLLLATVVIGGGFFIARNISLGSFIAQPTPVPPLKPLTALAQVQHLYPNAAVSFSHPLSDEIDLQTVLEGKADTPITPVQATAILSTYLRGYPSQTFWRWVDTNPISQTRTTYEVRPTELWLISINATFCTLNWTIYTITPDTLIKRGVSNHDYTTGISSHPGTGVPPGQSSGC